MSIAEHTGLNDQVSHEAAEWLVEFRSGDIDSAGRRDFDAWLRASPEHIRAFIEMAALWQEAGTIDPRRQLDVEAIVARAQNEPNVTQLAPAAAVRSDRGSLTRRPARIAPWALAASLSVAVLAAALVLDRGRPTPLTYATDAGVRRSILLPDGSKALLDSKSRLQVSYTAATRKVELLQGQALFSVIRNPRRPFLVEAGDALVRDVGTVFDVNRSGDGTIVTVVEGRVAAGGNGPAQPIYLSADEQLDVHIGQVSLQSVHVDASSETAWTHGHVVLESATLADVARVFNRYSKRRLVARDLGAKPLRLSGVFATDPEFVLGYLRSRPDVVMTETDSEIDIVRNPIRDTVH
jgi:transmembrane sensor